MTYDDSDSYYNGKLLAVEGPPIPGPPGPAGERGETGPAGPAGPQGPPGEFEGVTEVGQALGTAVDAAAARAALNIGTVMVEDFRDSARALTDTEIIRAAFDAVQPGGEVRFGAGVTYTITEDLLIEGFLKDGVLVNGQGATLSGAVSVLLSIRGSKYTATTTLTEAIATRSATLKVASTSGLLPGDLVAIRSSGELFTPDYTSFKQEMGRVAQVPDATTIVLESRTWDTYSITGNTVTVQRYVPVRDLTIRDLTVVGAGNVNQAGLNIRYFDGVTLQNVTSKRCATTGITGWEGINFTAVGCRAESSAGFNGSQGYGFTTSLAQSVKWLGCYGIGNRHSFDGFESRDISVIGCTAEGDHSSAISTHASTDVAKVIDCTVRECGGGIIVRGKNSTVRGNHILGTKTKTEQAADVKFSYGAGICVGQGSTTYDGLAGTNLIIDGNIIDLSGPDYSVSFEYAQVANSAILVHAPLVNAQITNNYMTGFPCSGIYDQADYNSNVVIAGNHLDCTAHYAATADIIMLAPRSDNAAAANVNTDITIFGNKISGSKRSAIQIAGGSTVDVRSDRIRIYDNRIGQCAQAKVDLNTGYFGADVSVYDTAADTDVTLSYTAGNFTEPPYVGFGGWYDTATRTMTNKTLVTPKVDVISTTTGATSLTLRSGTSDLAKFFAKAGTPVNYAYLENALTGQDPIIGSNGETFVGLKLQMRGNNTKFITLIDKTSSTMARFGTTASPVDYLTFYPGATTRIVADGASANVGINLEPKGISTVSVLGSPVGYKVAVPAGSSAPGLPGQWAANTTHYFVYTGDGVNHRWSRGALESTWAVTLEAVGGEEGITFAEDPVEEEEVS